MLWEPLLPYYERMKVLADNALSVEGRSRVVPMGEPLMVRKVTAFVAVPPELVAEAEADAEAAREWAALSAEERTERLREKTARLAEIRAAELAEDHEGWHATRVLLAGNPQAVAVLDIHYPVTGSPGVVCAHPVDGWEADAEEWPCSTYTAIKEA